MSDSTPCWRRRQQGSCLLVAEIAQAHDGSLGMAHAYVDAVADAGADAVKFQTHIASKESTAREPWRTQFSRQDATRYDYWRRMEFSPAQWRDLREHARDRGLLFLSSPFSPEAVDLLTDIGVDAWKIASGEVSNEPLLAALRGSEQPVLVSTGMSGWSEIDRAVEQIQALGLPVTLLQCTSMYPTPPERVGLGTMAQLRNRYDLPVGLSDHSGTIFAGMAAAALGAAVVEVHVALSREVFSPDLTVSVTMEELRLLAEGVKVIPAMCTASDKDAVSDELAPMRELFTKSLVAAGPLAEGHCLEPTDIACKKPGDGLPPSELGRLLGRSLNRSLAADEPIRDEDLVSVPEETTA